MPRLLTIKTDLSEYKAPQYGYDRRGAGPRNTNASGQPYEITNLPKRSFTISDYGRTSEKPDEDFLLRGGQLLPSTTLKDVSRLSKMLTRRSKIDPKNLSKKVNKSSFTTTNCPLHIRVLDSESECALVIVSYNLPVPLVNIDLDTRPLFSS